MNENIQKILNELSNEIEKIDSIKDKIDLINEIRYAIHLKSPLKHHPVDYVKWVKSEDMEGNDYNPNSVDRTNMKLLVTSIVEDGYTMPIVSGYEEESNTLKIVDGFHRRKSEIISKEISESTFGYLPTSLRRES